MRQQYIQLVTGVPGISNGPGRVALSDLPGHIQQVLLTQLPSDVHEASPIESYLAGYRNRLYRADDVSPVVLWNKTTDKYKTANSNDAFRRTHVRGGFTGEVQEITAGLGSAEFSMVPRYIGAFIPWESQNDADSPYDPEAAHLSLCSNALMLDREIEVCALGSTTTNFAASNRIALGAGYNWNGGASSDPIAVLQQMQRLSAMPITGFQMGLATAQSFITHDKVKDFVKSMVSEARIASITGNLNQLQNTIDNAVDFEIPTIGRIVVHSAQVLNESTLARDPIWPEGTVTGICHPATMPPRSTEEIATTLTFRHRGPSGTGFLSRRVSVDNRGPSGGQLLIVSMIETPVMSSTIAGAIATGAYV